MALRCCVSSNRFNLVEDPDELNNVVDEPQNKEVVEELRERLIGMLKSTPGFFADLKATIEVCHAACLLGVEDDGDTGVSPSVCVVPRPQLK